MDVRCSIEELKEKIELFLCEHAHPVLTETGREVVDLTSSSYSVSIQHDKLLWHVWNDQLNLVRQVTALRKETAYFRKNRKRMNYPAFRSKGMMIGSGPIEAGCKVVVGQRMKQAGMRWVHQGAENMLAIRTTVLNREYKTIDAIARAN